MFSQFLSFAAILLGLAAMSEPKPLNKRARFGGRAFGIRSITDSTPSTTQIVRIQCKNRYFLQIADDGVVGGSSNMTSPNVKLQLHAAGPHGLQRIYSPRTKRYIAMNSRGIVTSTLSPTNDTVFEYETLPTGFHTFRSVQHRNGQKSMYLALRDTGHIKKGSKTNRHHRSSSFLEIH